VYVFRLVRTVDMCVCVCVCLNVYVYVLKEKKKKKKKEKKGYFKIFIIKKYDYIYIIMF